MLALGHAAMVIATHNFEGPQAGPFDIDVATLIEPKLKIVRKDEGPRILSRLLGETGSNNHINVKKLLQPGHRIIKNAAGTMSVAVCVVPLRYRVSECVIYSIYSFIPNFIWHYFHLNLGSPEHLSNIPGKCGY